MVVVERSICNKPFRTLTHIFTKIALHFRLDLGLITNRIIVSL